MLESKLSMNCAEDCILDNTMAQAVPGPSILVGCSHKSRGLVLCGGCDDASGISKGRSTFA